VTSEALAIVQFWGLGEQPVRSFVEAAEIWTQLELLHRSFAV
jgi:hypothetical protein